MYFTLQRIEMKHLYQIRSNQILSINIKHYWEENFFEMI